MSLSAAEFDLRARISRRAGAMLDDLRRFVAIPTGPGGMAGLDVLRGLMCDRLAAAGGHVRLATGVPRPEWLSEAASGEPPPTAIVTGPRPEGSKRILLSGHLDTVHPVDSGFRELTLASDGAKATGPGVVDMKGGLVIALHAVEALAEAGVPVAWSFVLNSDEETGSYASDAALRAVAAEHDIGLALEPAMADGGLVIERPGSGQFMLEVQGRSAHVGRDFAAGISAVTALAHRLVALAAMARPDEGVIVSVGPIDGGHATNVVPDRARAWGNVRFINEDVGRALREQLMTLATKEVGEAALAAGQAAVTVRSSFNRPAKPLTDGTKVLAEAARAAAEDLGQKLPFGKTGGVCDGNNLQAAGLATIDTLGVRGGGLHTPQEWIELASLVERCQLLAVLMGRLSVGSPPLK